MEYSKFKSLLRRVIVIPMLVTAVLAALLLWESFDLNRALQWVNHTDQVLDQSARLLKLLADVETSMRGYLVTGDETLLQPYLEGTKRFDSEYQALYKLVDDSTPQTAATGEHPRRLCRVGGVHRQSDRPSSGETN